MQPKFLYFCLLLIVSNTFFWFMNNKKRNDLPHATLHGIFVPSLTVPVGGSLMNMAPQCIVPTPNKFLFFVLQHCLGLPRYIATTTVG